MREYAAIVAKRNVFRFAMTGLVGIWVSGCSTDSSRLTQGNPFSNPFASASDSAPTPRVSSTPLAAKSANPAYVAAAHPSPVAATTTASAAPPTTGVIRSSATAAPVGGTAAGWSAVGGSPIVVADGDTLATVSGRYGVPTAALLNVNGLQSASQVHAGMRLVVPVYSAPSKTAQAAPRAIDPPEAAQPVKSKRDEVAEVETKHEPKDAEPTRAKKTAKAKKDDDDSDDDDKPKSKLKKHEVEADNAPASRSEKAEKADKVEKAEKVAKAEKLEPSAKGSTHAVAEADAESSKAKKKGASEPTPAAPAAPARAPVVAEAEPAKVAKKKAGTDMSQTGAVAATAPAAAVTAAQADASGASPEFRWPARGRIIQGFKSGGNDGINIAVPEGTSVRAAEDGKVAYAGSALKGYGNLVLIRHPNGFVSAYANNGELNVKSGDTVKRGQVIAKSGQTGDVATPQLHFELRKGSTPVDPTNYLAGL